VTARAPFTARPACSGRHALYVRHRTAVVAGVVRTTFDGWACAACLFRTHPRSA
jgi:hypothetical protein